LYKILNFCTPKKKKKKRLFKGIFFGVEIKIILKYSKISTWNPQKNNLLFNRACGVVVALLPMYYSSFWVFRAPNVDKGGGGE
jgi:hypothetical protein